MPPVGHMHSGVLGRYEVSVQVALPRFCRTDVATLIRSPQLSCIGHYQEASGAIKEDQRRLMFTNPFPSGMKMAPEVAPLGPFPLVAGTGFEPATSGL